MPLMTFSGFRKNALTRGAVTAAALLSVTGLVACGGDDSSDKAAGAAGASTPTFEASASLAAVQTKAEDYGYTCTVTPADTTDLKTMTVQCLPPEGGDLQKSTILSLFDKADRASGTEVATAKVDADMKTATDANIDIKREDKLADYRTLDGDGVAGSCSETQTGTTETGNCENAAKALGLQIGRLDGATTADQRQQNAEDEVNRMEAESKAQYEADQKKKEEEERKKKEELQTYKGWDSLEAATEQLDAWDVHCTEEDASHGKVAWCGLHSTLVSVGMSVDTLEKEGVFDKVGRNEMVKVSDGDWTVLCTPGSRETCDLVADKTGKSVEQGA